MTRRRWIADEVSGNHAALTGEHADHLARVLRVRVGQEFDIVSGDLVRVGRVCAIDHGRVEFELGERLSSATTFPLSLAMAIIKFDRMEWAIEKCTELGVSGIVPVIARRTDSHLVKAADKRAERWERIAREASEQSRRAVPPEISHPITVREAVSLAAPLRILLSETEKAISIKQALEKPDASSIIVALGPEGGWAKEEERAFRQAGWVGASLGPTILRAETAAIAATAVVLSELLSLTHH
jgi:16S rRNA (uracil1498-N3)-methyltransferase